jgi:hypothetical protein
LLSELHLYEASSTLKSRRTQQVPPQEPQEAGCAPCTEPEVSFSVLGILNRLIGFPSAVDDAFDSAVTAIIDPAVSWSCSMSDFDSTTDMFEDATSDFPQRDHAMMAICISSKDVATLIMPHLPLTTNSSLIWCPTQNTINRRHAEFNPFHLPSTSIHPRHTHIIEPCRGRRRLCLRNGVARLTPSQSHRSRKLEPTNP